MKNNSKPYSYRFKENSRQRENYPQINLTLKSVKGYVSRSELEEIRWYLELALHRERQYVERLVPVEVWSERWRRSGDMNAGQLGEKQGRRRFSRGLALIDPRFSTCLDPVSHGTDSEPRRK